jgi:hypothetical protein
MDEDRPSISSRHLYARLGADAAPTTRGVRHSVDRDDKLVVPTRDQVERLSAHPLRESSVVVYCGNEQQVSEGFALALHAMGIEANILPVGIAPATNNPNREDN